MDLTVIVATFGSDWWRELAQQRAVPSAQRQASTVHVHGRTLAAARNTGAARAATEWLCFLDADDELAPGYVAAMSAAAGDLRAPAVSYITGASVERPKFWPAPAGGFVDGNHLLIGTLVRREMFLRVGGFRDYDFYEDWDLWTRCWLAGAVVAEVPGAVYLAHVNPRSRNRLPSRDEQLAMHDRIRRANFPHLYEAAA